MVKIDPLRVVKRPADPDARVCDRCKVEYRYFVAYIICLTPSSEFILVRSSSPSTADQGLNEGRKASHSSFLSEPHSPHFIVRTTSKTSSFGYYVLKSF